MDSCYDTWSTSTILQYYNTIPRLGIAAADDLQDDDVEGHTLYEFARTRWRHAHAYTTSLILLLLLSLYDSCAAGTQYNRGGGGRGVAGTSGVHAGVRPRARTRRFRPRPVYRTPVIGWSKVAHGRPFSNRTDTRTRAQDTGRRRRTLVAMAARPRQRRCVDRREERSKNKSPTGTRGPRITATGSGLADPSAVGFITIIVDVVIIARVVRSRSFYEWPSSACIAHARTYYFNVYRCFPLPTPIGSQYAGIIILYYVHVTCILLYSRERFAFFRFWRKR